MKTLRFNAIKILNEQRQQKIYKSMHKNAAKPHESVGWLSEERQNIRFEKLTLNIAGGSSLLDFGCGLGDLWGYIFKQGIDIKYFGIDIIEEFVLIAKNRYPKANFAKASIFDIKERFDYVLSSGVYAFSKREVFERAIVHSFDLATKEYRFNVLVDANGSGYFRISQKELERFVKSICPNASFYSGYLNNDITVFMPKS